MTSGHVERGAAIVVWLVEVPTLLLEREQTLNVTTGSSCTEERGEDGVSEQLHFLRERGTHQVRGDTPSEGGYTQ